MWVLLCRELIGTFFSWHLTNLNVGGLRNRMLRNLISMSPHKESNIKRSTWVLFVPNCVHISNEFWLKEKGEVNVRMRRVSQKWQKGRFRMSRNQETLEGFRGRPFSRHAPPLGTPTSWEWKDHKYPEKLVCEACPSRREFLTEQSVSHVSTLDASCWW